MSETYFLGSSTANGFVTTFDSIIKDEKMFTYILKGGAGTGKSSLMKKVANEVENYEHVLRYHCSSDPDSLDAVVLTESGVVIVDGTAPHVFDPIIPGVNQKIVNLGDYWNEDLLKANKENIVNAINANKSALDRARRFTAALTNIFSDTCHIGSDSLLYKKTESFISRFKKKILPKKGNGTGKTSLFQLSALTRYGYLTYTETLDDYFDIYYLKDEYYAATDFILKAVAVEATARNFDVIISPCQLFAYENYEHLLIPELGIAIVGANPMTNLCLDNGKIINASRFYDKKLIAQKKSRLKLNKTTYADLCKETAYTLENAKIIHDEIEKYYIEAMNFDKINEITENIISEIKSKHQ
ncbi:MAG: ATPase [Ruminococcus sp.]|nr:ATPase [Ruminococcus sp.]